MNCPNCKQCSSYDYPYCPCCGTKQNGLHVSSNGKTPDSKPDNGGSIPPACVPFKPFRAWVAWHPDRGTDYDTFSTTKTDSWFALKGSPEQKTSALRKGGWRVICVEVKPVEGKSNE